VRQAVVVHRSAAVRRRSAASGPIKPPSPNSSCDAPAELRIVIADHGLLERRRLRRHLAEVEAVSGIVECGSAPAARAAIERERPHVLFLEADLPGGASLDPPGARGRCTPIVILMSGDTGTLRSFAARRREYLRKPVVREAVREALDRVRRHVRLTGRDADDRSAAADQRHGIPGRLVVRSGGRILAVPTAYVEWIEAEDNYVHVHKGDEAHVVRETLSALEARLDSSQFVRIHRGALVNVESVEELRSVRGAWQLRLRAGTTLAVGRKYRSRLREILTA
jgi:two-component system LytT family response regulator